jgi:signal recognition particle receptor subunit beta
MALFNHTTKELTAKIVYYGPGLCGKTTNLRVLHGQLERATKGRLLSLATAQDRTIYFDLLPIELGNIKGYTVRFQLCTVPGQVFYNETRKIVLRGVDGIVFVVDSQWSMLSHNLESFQNLRENLAEEKSALESIPLVVQYNKRDLPGSMSIEALQGALGFAALPFVEAVASDGMGVVETFRLVSKLTFVDLLRRLQKGGPASSEMAAAALAAAADVSPVATPESEPVFAAEEPEPPRPAAPDLQPNGSGAAVGLAEAAPEGEDPGLPPIPDVSFDDDVSLPSAAPVDAFADLDDDEIPRETPRATAAGEDPKRMPPEPEASEPPASAAQTEASKTEPAAESGSVPHEPIRTSSPGAPLPENAGALTAIERIRREVEERRLRMQAESRAFASSEIPKTRFAGLFDLPKPSEPPPVRFGESAGETQQIGAIRPDDAEVRRLEDSLTRAIRSLDEESGRRREAEKGMTDRIGALEAEIGRLSTELAETRGREEALKDLAEALTRKWDALRRLLSEDPAS